MFCLIRPLREEPTVDIKEVMTKGIKYMMTSSNGNIFRVTGPMCGEFTGPGEFPAQRPVTRSFDVFFDLHLNERLSKQPWGWWFETLSFSLWRQCNVTKKPRDLYITDTSSEESIAYCWILRKMTSNAEGITWTVIFRQLNIIP